MKNFFLSVKYFYSIQHISIGGRCVCNGHAEKCDALNYKPDKLVCGCSHYTCGDQCQECCPGFQQKPWRPSRENDEFECEPCQCYGHSNECLYDPEIDAKKLSIDIHGNYEGGGVCQSCQHNTEGINCEKCKRGFYRPFDVPIDTEDACRPCECNNQYSTGNCAESTGQCECKPQYTGKNCEMCADGYTDWPNCKQCPCNHNGSLDGGSCFPPCRCKFGFLGPNCDKCVDGYYGFPDCRPCQCDHKGRFSLNCDLITGQCYCRMGYKGVQCEECDNGYYNLDGQVCSPCNCDTTGTTDDVCNKNTGTCMCKENYAGERCDKCAPGFYDFPSCLSCSCDLEGSVDNECISFGTSKQCKCVVGRGGPECRECAPGFFKFPECSDCECDEAGSIGRSCDPKTGKCKCKQNFIGDKCAECAPNLFNYPHCEECRCHPDGTSSEFPGCNKNLKQAQGIVCPCRANVQGRQCDQCKDGFYGLSKENPKGCSMCECAKEGTLNELSTCDQSTGQCQCKPFVTSANCNECKAGTYKVERDNLFGCQTCDCQVGSSIDNNCDPDTGKCSCLQGIVGNKCDRPIQNYYIPSLHHLKYEMESCFTGSSFNPETRTFDNIKFVRVLNDEQIMPNYSSTGFMKLNKLNGEVMQRIEVKTPGTYRMIIRYVNQNPEESELFIRIKPTEAGKSEEQNTTMYLPQSVGPKFESILVNRMSAFPLELENAEYFFTFQNSLDNVFLDYFVLLPSNYYESTVLQENVEEACRDFRDEHLCIQYQYLPLDKFSHQYALNNENAGKIDSVNIDDIKEFNHTEKSPLNIAKLNKENSLNLNMMFPSESKFVALVDFMNLNDDGQEMDVEVVHDGSNKVQKGHVYLYKCNYTTICREVILGKDLNKPLVIDGVKSADFILKSGSRNGKLLINKLTLVPLSKFDVNMIKLAPYCIVKDKVCIPMEYSPLPSQKVELDESMERSLLPIQKSAPSHIPSSKTVYLNDFMPEMTVPVSKASSEDQVLIVYYYQPNHASVNVSVNIDNVNRGSFQADYCPSISGCRSVVNFESSGEAFSNPEIRSVQFELSQNGQDIWLDYILFVPSAQVNFETLNSHAPIDLTDEFVKKCATNHFHIESNSNEFCDRAVFSLSAAYNNGAKSCDCEPSGSVSAACEVFGGKCQCKPNIVGQHCDACKSGHYKFPDCLPCDCPSGNCDPVTGQCACPPNVINNCTVCADETFGFHPVYGCEPCACDLDSTVDSSNMCSKETGQCDCKPNYDSLKCDQCKAGYYSYPECIECGCDKRGTNSQICDPTTAQCKCKENVKGELCQECHEDSYNLEASNPKGCTKCFCFGMTTRCRQPNHLFYRRLKYFIPTEIDDWSDWSLSLPKTIDPELAKGIKLMNRTNFEGLMVELSDEVKNSEVKLDESIYFIAPKPFIGDKVTSYGATIRYKIDHGQVSSKTYEPVLVLSGMNMTLVHYAKSDVLEETVALVESEFVHLNSNMKPSREQLLTVLSNLKAVKIRAMYSPKPHFVELVNFEFDQAVEATEEGADETRLASRAEYCTCPQNYRGYSCENCVDGFYKVPSLGPGAFGCAPCNCNNHAEACDQETGICTECLDNTEGIFSRFFLTTEINLMMVQTVV